MTCHCSPLGCVCGSSARTKVISDAAREVASWPQWKRDIVAENLRRPIARPDGWPCNGEKDPQWTQEAI